MKNLVHYIIDAAEFDHFEMVERVYLLNMNDIFYSQIT